MANEDPNVTVAKFSFKQAIIVAAITGATTLGATFLTMKSSSNDGGAEPVVANDSENGCEEEVSDLKQSLQSSIAFSSLVDISSTHFASDGDKNKVRESIRSLVRTSEAYSKDSQHYMHKLFRLKKLMLANGGNINVRVSNANQEACGLIQDLLKGIEYYRGSIDGNVESTREAVENFQNKLNSYTPEYFAEQNIGIVGKKTFNAIMEHYERD